MASMRPMGLWDAEDAMTPLKNALIWLCVTQLSVICVKEGGNYVAEAPGAMQEHFP